MESILLNKETADKIFDKMENSPEPNEALLKASARYKQKAMSLFKPPFRYDSMGGYIWDSENNMFADQEEIEMGTISRLRGWGRLSYLEDGEEIQDAMGEIFAEALNMYFERNKEKS